jgi:signal transduction histidine kinase
VAARDADLRLSRPPDQPAPCTSAGAGGLSVAEDKLEKIFEPFVQVRSELTREHGGTGLGPAISRSMPKRWPAP